MKKKLVFGLSAVVVSGAFWACGSGEVITYDNNLEGLTMALVGDISEAEVVQAIKDCQENPQCAAEMQEVPDLLGSSSSTPQSSSRAQIFSSNQTPTSSMMPQSSMKFVPQSSSAPVFASSTSVPPVESSSSSVIPGPGSDYGTCSPVKNPINRGEKTAWKMTKAATLDAQVILNADFDWTFVDGAPLTSAKHANMSSDEITYANSGLKAATLVFTPQGGAPVSIDCTPLQVNGAAITGCVCAAASETVDVAEGGVATWTVKGCASSGAQIIGYTWGGAGVTGEGTAGTATLAAKGDVVQPTVIVANDDNTQATVTCPAVTAIDARLPDYIIEGLQTDGVIDIPAGTNTVHIAVNCSQNATFFCNGEGQISGKVGGATLSGSHYASTKISPEYCSGSASVEVTLNIDAKCGVY